jgi:hypothetical protein
MLLDVDVGAEKECCQILFVSMEDLAVFRKGIVPLFKVDICLSLE